VAPAVQLPLHDDRSTPYVAAGVTYVDLSLGLVESKAFGYFANAGYELRWKGFGLVLGAGVLRSPPVRSINGALTVAGAGQLGFNFEAGLRYQLL
jgi:hypothetical protein